MKVFLIRKQLRRQGAAPKDASELASVANKISSATPTLSPEAKKQIARDIGFKPVRANANFRYASAGVFVLLIVLVVVAQSAQPGSMLYALKRGSEEVRVIVQPGFDDDDLQKRRQDEQRKAEEINHQDNDSNDSSELEDMQKQTEDDHIESEDEAKIIEDRQADEPENDFDSEDTPEIKPEDNSGSGSSIDD